MSTRVLVVDDSPTILRIIESVLVGADIDVFVASNGDDGLKLAAEKKPQLILLDQVMPRMTGYLFCQKLSAQEALQNIPVVMMTSKGDPGSDRFINAANVVDYVSKPFSPEVILSITVHSLEKFNSAADEKIEDPALSPKFLSSAEMPAASEPQAPDNALQNDALLWETSPLADEAAAVLQARHEDLEFHYDDSSREHDDEVTEIIAEGPAQDEQFQFESTLPNAHADDLAHVDDQATLVGAVPDDNNALSGRGDGAILWAELGQVPLPELLQLLQLQSHSGLFKIWSTHSSFDIFIRRGRVLATQARGADQELRLGRFLVSRDLIGSTELEQLARSGSGSQTLPLGEKLVRLGHIRADQLREALADQCRELFYEALRVRVGRCAMYPGVQPPPEFDAMLVDLEIPSLLLEGMRRVDEWSVIEREVPNFDQVFELRRSGMTDPADLTSDERRLLMLVDGKRSVRELVAAARLRPFKACKMLYRLAATRQIQRMNENNKSESPNKNAPLFA